MKAKMQRTKNKSQNGNYSTKGNAMTPKLLCMVHIFLSKEMRK